MPQRYQRPVGCTDSIFPAKTPIQPPQLTSPRRGRITPKNPEVDRPDNLHAGLWVPIIRFGRVMPRPVTDVVRAPARKDHRASLARARRLMASPRHKSLGPFSEQNVRCHLALSP